MKNRYPTLLVSGLLALASLVAATPVTSPAWSSSLTQVSHQARLNQQMGVPNQASGAMLFVSLGMPTLALRQTLQQAAHYQVPVVIRGLVNDSVPETSKRLYTVLHPRNHNPIVAGVQIDPTLFQAYHVTVVPTLVVTDRVLACEQQRNCPPAAYSSVAGNVPLASLLNEVARRAQTLRLRQVAQQVLARGEVQ